jgi:hypothetical protein
MLPAVVAATPDLPRRLRLLVPPSFPSPALVQTNGLTRRLTRRSPRSWAFVYSSGILILGVGMSFSPATCSLGIFSCIFFYASSKVLICASLSGLSTAALH